MKQLKGGLVLLTDQTHAFSKALKAKLCVFNSC